MLIQTDKFRFVPPPFERGEVLSQRVFNFYKIVNN